MRLSRGSCARRLHDPKDGFAVRAGGEWEEHAMRPRIDRYGVRAVARVLVIDGDEAGLTDVEPQREARGELAVARTAVGNLLLRRAGERDDSESAQPRAVRFVGAAGLVLVL